MISFLSQAHDSPPFCHTQLQLKESWKRRQGEKEGVGSLARCEELAVIPRGGASPRPLPGPQHSETGLRWPERKPGGWGQGRQQGHPGILVSPLLVSMNSTSRGLVYKGWEVGQDWLQQLSIKLWAPLGKEGGWCFQVLTNECVHLSWWASESVTALGYPDRVRSWTRLLLGSESAVPRTMAWSAGC